MQIEKDSLSNLLKYNGMQMSQCKRNAPSVFRLSVRSSARDEWVVCREIYFNYTTDIQY